MDTADDASLRRLQRAYRALSECHAAIVQAEDEPQLLAGLCTKLVEVGGYRMAWVGFPDNDTEHTVRPVAAAGLEDGYLAGVHVSWDESPNGRGPTGVAIRTGLTALNQHVDTNPAYAPWRAAALRQGYASSISVPLIAHGRMLGALSVYSAVADAFDDEERALLEGLGRSLAFGLSALRTRQELRARDEQLRAAAKMEALGQLATGVVHDLNNLLMAIGGCADELSDATGEQRDVLMKELQDSLNSAGSVTRQLLAFGRGPGTVRRSCTVTESLERVTPLLRRSLGKHVALTLDVASDLATALVDPVELEQALLNLALNARDAMDGMGSVTVRVRNAHDIPASAVPMRTDARAMVELSIADSGSGMPPDVLRQLFQPFFTTKPPGKGTGLGLAMVRNVVEHHDGQLAVESTVGRGTTFRLFLPAA